MYMWTIRIIQNLYKYKIVKWIYDNDVQIDKHMH